MLFPALPLQGVSPFGRDLALLTAPSPRAAAAQQQGAADQEGVQGGEGPQVRAAAASADADDGDDEVAWC